MVRLEDSREVLSSWLLLMLCPPSEISSCSDWGPDDLDGNGYFYMRLCWTGVGFQANFDEEYELLCAMLLFSQLV